MPFSNRAQISFPAIREAMRKLTAWGVIVLVGDNIYEQHEPGTGDNYVHLFPWLGKHSANTHGSGATRACPVDLLGGMR
jgi:hypothetical protein